LLGGRFHVFSTSTPPASLFYNDEWNVNGLELNRRASYLLWLHAKHYRASAVIGGDALLTGPADGRGITKPVPDDMVSLLLETESYAVEFLNNPQSPYIRDMLTFTEWPDAYEYALTLVRRFMHLTDVRVVRA
jgi:hypothetical protein